MCIYIYDALSRFQSVLFRAPCLALEGCMKRSNRSQMSVLILSCEGHSPEPSSHSAHS